MIEDSHADFAHWAHHRFYGKYRGTVASNEDPTARARLKVKVPSVLGALEVWALPCVPYAGKGVGFYSLPDPGTAVWVEFERGDVSQAIWVGCFWADDELPDENAAKVKIWKTTTTAVRVDDDKKQIAVTSTDGASVTIVNTVVDKAGDTTHTTSTTSVKSEVGPKSLELSASSLSVHSGAFEVV